MKHAEIEAYSKQKIKERRMQVEKIKDAARHQMQERQDKRSDSVNVEKYLHDVRHSET